MEVSEFRERGKEMVDYICEYMDGIGSRRVTPNIEPGYLRSLLPEEAPLQPEPWEDIMRDVETKIMPGVTHWQHPRFHAYFPSGNSFPSILGDMLSDAIGCIGFSWAASPACTELETIVLDWLGRAIGLPEDFLAHNKESRGGGVLQSSASECILVSMLAARSAALSRLREEDPETHQGLHLSRLVAYCSREAHSCVEKAALIALVTLRILEPDENNALRGETVREAMERDIEAGLVPFFVSCTLGTTSCCSFDRVGEVGPVCRQYDSWMHIDAAYAGNAFICPEFQHLHKEGTKYADSFNTNPNKWLLTNFDISCLWVRDRYKLTSAMVVDPIYLQHAHSEETIDYRHWGIPLSRRFRALKLWFVIRSYGLEGLRRYIRLHCRLAKRFASAVEKDSRFEIANDVRMGLVCFKLRAPQYQQQQYTSDNVTKLLLARINGSGKLHMIPSMVRGHYVIRFCVTAERACEDDIDHAWEVITEMASELLDSIKIPTPAPVTAPMSRHRQLSQRFSFTRSVSRDVFQRSQSRTSLYDGVSPIIVLDEDMNEVKTDVFTFSQQHVEASSIIEEQDRMLLKGV